nr:MAG TPA: hypothetical protein [Caudoviricetes sp.]
MRFYLLRDRTFFIYQVKTVKIEKTELPRY